MTPIMNLQGQKVGFLKADIRSTAKKDSVFNSSNVISQNYKTTNNLPIHTDPISLQASIELKKQPQNLKIASIIGNCIIIQLMFPI